MTIHTIYIGGWFQRTTLHLTELFDFLKHGESSLDIDKKELMQTRRALALTEVTRENGPLEYILVETSKKLRYRLYEDGLIVLEKPFTNLKKDFNDIKGYYDKELSKAISLIFSKGAPVPKELASIKTILPYIVTVTDAKKEEIDTIFKEFDEEVYSVMTTQNIEVFRSSGLIIINNLHDEHLTREIIESQIFFREFKSQLHRYLTIHRILWEKIKIIKERGAIRGKDIDVLRNELSLYQKTINLIGARIEQMPAYVRTRQKITNVERIDTYLQPLFQFKFETLLDTHEYVKHLWKMTENYLNSTLEIFSELQEKSTKSGLSSLQVITTIGVVSGILSYLSKDTLPTFTIVGFVYFMLLMAMTWGINGIVSRFFKNKKYDIEECDIEKNIK